MTHHDLLELVAPFARRGRHVDLAATDRHRRRVVFKSIDDPESSAGLALHETLGLDDLGAGSYRLTRVLSGKASPDVCLEAVGTEPAELLARIEAVPPQRQIRVHEGVVVAVSYRLEPDSAPDPAAMVFTRGKARVGGLELEVEASARRGPAAVALARMPGDELCLPQDTLAVLGGRWSRLRDSEMGWAAQLRLPGKEPARTRQAKSAIETAALHLSHMLAEPPRRFHERWTGARWRVFCRRLMPLVVCLGLILGATAVPRLHLANSSGLRMLLFNSPPLLMVLIFCLREIPIVEIPPLPRRSDAASWRTVRPEPSTGRQRESSARATDA